MAEFIVWMQSTWVAHFMANWQWAWPWAEVLHFIGMSILFGAIIVMDTRLMGFFRQHIPLHAVHALTPWAIVGFLINLLTGMAFIFKDGDRLLPNPSLLFKMLCVLLAGVNFLVFWFKIRKDSHGWQEDGDPPLSAKLVGATSILLWTLVIWAGRMIPVYGVG